MHEIQLVDDVLHERRDDVRGLRVHDCILAIGVQQDFVQALLKCRQYVRWINLIDATKIEPRDGDVDWAKPVPGRLSRPEGLESG